ncbi:MAG: antitoxin [Chloroflexota bacterium]
MTRTTIDLAPSVLRELRRRSRQEGKSMGQVASEALARDLAGRERQPDPPFEWTSGDRGEPRVDLDDREAVQAILDARS